MCKVAGWFLVRSVECARALFSSPGETGALVEDVVEWAVWVAALTVIHFILDVGSEAASIGGRECHLMARDGQPSVSKSVSTMSHSSASLTAAHFIELLTEMTSLACSSARSKCKTESA